MGLCTSTFLPTYPQFYIVKIFQLWIHQTPCFALRSIASRRLCITTGTRWSSDKVVDLCVENREVTSCGRPCHPNFRGYQCEDCTRTSSGASTVSITVDVNVLVLDTPPNGEVPPLRPYSSFRTIFYLLSCVVAHRHSRLKDYAYRGV